MGRGPPASAVVQGNRKSTQKGATVWRMNRPWVKTEVALRVDEAPFVSNGATEIPLVTLELTGEPDPAGRQPAESFLVRVSSVGRFLCSPSRRDAVDFRGIRKKKSTRIQLYRSILLSQIISTNSHGTLLEHHSFLGGCLPK